MPGNIRPLSSFCVQRNSHNNNPNPFLRKRFAPCFFLLGLFCFPFSFCNERYCFRRWFVASCIDSQCVLFSSLFRETLRLHDCTYHQTMRHFFSSFFLWSLLSFIYPFPSFFLFLWIQIFWPVDIGQGMLID